MAADRGKRERVRFTLEVNFESVVVKESFAKVLTAVRDLSTPRKAPKLTLDNLHLLLALVDRASSHHRLPTNTSEAADAGSCSGVLTVSWWASSAVGYLYTNSVGYSIYDTTDRPVYMLPSFIA